MHILFKFVTPIFLLICLVSCKENSNKTDELALKEKELQLQEKELELKERELKLNEQSKNSSFPSSTSSYPKDDPAVSTTIDFNPASASKTKFCYVYVETNEPEEEYMFGDMNGLGGKLFAAPKFFKYKSSVIEVKNYNEDEKYKLIDEFEKQVRDQYEIKNMRLANLNSECKILSSECFTFDTYKAASEHRRKK